MFDTSCDLNLLSGTNPGTGTYTSAEQINPAGVGVKVVVDITAISGGATLTVTIRGRDKTSGKQWTLLASTALNAIGTTVLTVYPGLTASANATASDALPYRWDVTAAVAVAGTVTYTIGGCRLA